MHGKGDIMFEMLEKNDFQEIQSWVHRNARPLEYTLWKFHFESGCIEDVLAALAVYQNEDGGFGKILEPDNWNPESTPYNTEFAINILKQIGFYDLTHPIYRGILKYLEDTIYQGFSGWFFTVPGNNEYPHAIWWTHNEKENNEHQNIGITASLSGFILRYTEPEIKLYDKALEYTEMLFDKLRSNDNFGDMGLLGYCSLYEDLKETELHNKFDLKFLKEKISLMIEEHFHEYVWTNHQDIATVLPTTSVFYYKGKEQAVTNALDELINIRPSQGVWGIPWEWYDNGLYVREFAISENWWKSYKAIEKVLFLREHGRLRMD